jgi:1,4-dihydroxy-2-naphthoyl-CoA hydrolase
MIWFKKHTLDEINDQCKNTMVEFLDIKVSKITDDQLEAIMPVSDKIRQPYGIVHGGANCVLAETLGSLAANFTVDYKEFHAVGLSINTSHVKAVRNGNVRGVASVEHMGRTTQVWKIETFNDANQLTSLTTLTMAIISKLK